MLELLQKILKFGNGGMSAIGTLAIAAPFLMQKQEVLQVPYPLLGVVILLFALWAEIARRTPN